MKRFLPILVFFLFATGVFGQSTLSVNSSTGAIAGPVSAATFRSGNTIQTQSANLDAWSLLSPGDYTPTSGFGSLAFLSSVAFPDVTGLAIPSQIDWTPTAKTEAATVTLTRGTISYSTASGTLTQIAFAGTAHESDPATKLNLIVTSGPYTLTVPTSRRVGDTNSTTSLTLNTGNHELSWRRINGEDWLADSTSVAKKGYLQLVRPQRVDGTGCVYQNSDSTQNYFGQGKFSNSAAATGNFVEYRLIVPEDIDTSVDLRARFEFRLSNTDTGKHRYIISMADVTDSSSSGGTLTNTVNLDFTGDASGASGDIETVGWTTLTSWKGSLTAGHHFVIRVARSGDDGTNDTSTVDSYSGPLEIEYTQK